MLGNVVRQSWVRLVVEWVLDCRIQLFLFTQPSKSLRFGKKKCMGLEGTFKWERLCLYLREMTPWPDDSAPVWFSPRHLNKCDDASTFNDSFNDSWIYIAPLQGNYSASTMPSLGRVYLWVEILKGSYINFNWLFDWLIDWLIGFYLNGICRLRATAFFNDLVKVMRC